VGADDELPTVRKVSAFITRGSRLMVFRKPYHPGTGTQVPAGTIEPGETPEHAVLREAQEETGRAGFTLHELLDHRRIDMRPYGRDEIHDRWSYHLSAPCTIPRTWRHGESHPSSGPDRFISFDFFWIDIQRARGELRAENHHALAVLQQLPGETSDALRPDRRGQFGQGTAAW
jgi:8-oxo-dGTP pyrophosphatase MutT (NUDIX family)